MTENTGFQASFECSIDMDPSPATSHPVIQWLEQPVFISSTFMDMQAERDILHDRVFPELRRRLAAYHRTLAPVDLRNGVETVGIDKKEEKELQVLSVCLDEINRCKPFLLVILGERYGWVPERERVETVIGVRIQDENFAELRGISIENKSVTALEIEYGVLASSEKRKRSFFCFREISDSDSIPEDKRAIYDDRFSSDPATLKRHGLLTALKQDVRSRKEFKGRIIDYTARYDATRDGLVDLESWAGHITEIMWKDLEEDCIAYEEEMRTSDPHYDSWQSTERRSLEEFLAGRRRGFIGRKEEVDSAVLYLIDKKSSSKQGLCIIGEAGTGKSALFAKVHEKLEKKRENGSVLLLVHSAGVSSRAGSTDYIISRWIQELATFLNLSTWDPAAELDTLKKKLELFSHLLYEAQKKCRVVLAIDSLDNLDQSTEALTMSWLPDILYPDVRFFATAIPGDISNACARKPWCEVREIKPFVSKYGNDKNAREFIYNQCLRLHKNPLNNAVVNALVSIVNQQTGLPACGNPLWLSIAVNRLLNLDADDFRGIATVYSKEDEDCRILSYQLKLVSSMPGTVEDLYDDFFKYCSTQFGLRMNIPWIDRMLDYIACSRRGLRESDLEGLLLFEKNYTKGTVDQTLINERNFEFSLQFAMVRNYLAAHLVQRSELGLWDFVHTAARYARMNGHYADSGIDKTSLSNPKYRQWIHIMLAYWLENCDQKDSLRSREIMFHYFHGDLKERAGTYYGRPYWEFNTNELIWATETITEEIVFEENAARNKETSTIGSPIINPAINWIEKVIANCITDREKHLWCLNINYFINSALENKQGLLKARVSVLEIALRSQEELSRKEIDTTQIESEISVSCDNLGKIQVQLGNLTYALGYFTRSLTIREELLRKNPEDAQVARNLSISLNNIGEIQVQLGNCNDAFNHFSRSFLICEACFHKNPEDAQASRNVWVSCNNLGHIQLQMGKIDEALKHFVRSLKIAEELYRKNPDDVETSRDLSLSYENLGTIQLQRGNLDDVLNYFSRSLNIREKLSCKNPENAQIARDLLVGYNNLGKIQLRLGNVNDAFDHFRTSLTICEERFRKNPDDAQAARDLSVNCDDFGNIQLKLGKINDALEHFSHSLKIRKDLTRKNPNDAQAARDLSISCDNLGKIYFQLGNNNDALTQYMASLTIGEELARKNPDDAQAARDLSINYDNLGKIQFQLGNSDYALKYLTASLKIREELSNKNPDDVSAAWNLSLICNNLGYVQLQLGNFTDALNLFTRSIAIGEELFGKNPHDAQAACDLSISYDNLGKIQFQLDDATEALSHFTRSMVIRKELSDKNPEDAQAASNLCISLFNIHCLHANQNNNTDATVHAHQCLRLLQKMEQNGMHISDDLKDAAVQIKQYMECQK